VTAAPEGPGGAHPLADTRHEAVARDEHASIVRSLTHVDWLVLLVVALYSLAPHLEPTSPRWLYAAMAAYTLFLIAFRLRSFPVRDTRARIALGAAVMVAFITVVAMQTGGSTGPMANLYLLPIVLVAMTLGARGALVVVAAVALAWLSVVIDEAPLPPPGELLARLFGELGPYALVAYLTQALAGSVMMARRRIEEMAERDGLTGMLNLRTFKSILHREHQLRVRGAPGGYAILLVDVDRLKELNDEHGHQAGNRAITTVAGAVQRAIRTSDMAARYGGDEFVVFLPGATPEVAEIVAQRIRNNVYKSLFPVGERLQRMTVSVGTASYPRDGAQQDDIVAAAVQRVRRDRELRKTAAAPADDSGQHGETGSAS
jgi:diguanylate cyclase (GGDEF)-like protein